MTVLFWTLHHISWKSDNEEINLRAHQLHLACVDKETLFDWSGHVGFGIINGNLRVIDEFVIQVVHILDLFLSAPDLTSISIAYLLLCWTLLRRLVILFGEPPGYLLGIPFES